MNPKKRLRLAEEKFQAGKDAIDASQYQLAVTHNINNPVGTIQLAAQRGLRNLKQ